MKTMILASTPQSAMQTERVYVLTPGDWVQVRTSMDANGHWQDRGCPVPRDGEIVGRGGLWVADEHGGFIAVMPDRAHFDEYLSQTMRGEVREEIPV